MTATDTIYNLNGLAATYTPSGGSGSAVTVLFREGGDLEKDGANRRHRARIKVRQSEVADRPTYRSTFLIGSDTWTIVDDGVRELKASPYHDAEWLCECSKGERVPL